MTHERINKLDFIKISSCSSTKDCRENKKMATDIKYIIFANVISNKGLLSKIYKELLKLSHKKMYTLTKILAKDIYQAVYQGKYIDVVNMHMKGYSIICNQECKLKQ